MTLVIVIGGFRAIFTYWHGPENLLLYVEAAAAISAKIQCHIDISRALPVMG